MRPRHKAAEYHHRRLRLDAGLRASMRPRHKAAEYALLGAGGIELHVRASMRPRHKAAEYVFSVSQFSYHLGTCFNEAAA